MGNKKGGEKGLLYQIKELEDNIALKEKLGKPVKFEKDILRAYKKYAQDNA